MTWSESGYPTVDELREQLAGYNKELNAQKAQYEALEDKQTPDAASLRQHVVAKQKWISHLQEFLQRERMVIALEAIAERLGGVEASLDSKFFPETD